jgi:hypothetical protein
MTTQRARASSRPQIESKIEPTLLSRRSSFARGAASATGPGTGHGIGTAGRPNASAPITRAPSGQSSLRLGGSLAIGRARLVPPPSATRQRGCGHETARPNATHPVVPEMTSSEYLRALQEAQHQVFSSLGLVATPSTVAAATNATAEGDGASTILPRPGWRQAVLEAQQKRDALLDALIRAQKAKLRKTAPPWK